MKKVKQAVVKKKVIIGNRVRKTVIVAVKPKPAPKAEAKPKKVRRIKSEVQFLGRPLSVDFAKETKYPAIVMMPRQTPFTSEPGPYVEVVVKDGSRKDAPKIWVRVTKGDDRNGEGYLAQTIETFPFPARMKIRFGGGTALTPPRMFADDEGPVETRKAVALN